ncbi:response regulator transcription factor [Microvirga sp. Mcv34]|uniref:response regulator transcription factor n=1 Tax=Microvirga sp. Mcv34 TaxID=2926016 RepID=UPI0021C57839|nr:helix-turn-helix transcriptional regulator [Microvirga sp. Mcv34]
MVAWRHLSEREKQILKLAADGAGSKETGSILGITDATVKVHRKSLYRKMGAKNAPHAVAIAFRKGWFDEEKAAG